MHIHVGMSGWTFCGSTTNPLSASDQTIAEFTSRKLNWPKSFPAAFANSRPLTPHLQESPGHTINTCIGWVYPSNVNTWLVSNPRLLSAPCPVRLVTHPWLLSAPLGCNHIWLPSPAIISIYGRIATIKSCILITKYRFPVEIMLILVVYYSYWFPYLGFLLISIDSID